MAGLPSHRSKYALPGSVPFFEWARAHSFRPYSQLTVNLSGHATSFKVEED